MTRKSAGFGPARCSTRSDRRSRSAN